jgi:hypothetical protein
VNFSFAEMAIIARRLGISLDNIAGIENLQSKPTKLNISKQVNSTKYDYQMFETYINLLKSIKDEPDTKIWEAGNIFPHYLYLDYERLTRFYLFKWNQSSSYGSALPYHEITIPEQLRVMQKDVCKYARFVKSTIYVLDYLIFQRLVTTIQYFSRIRLIKNEDIEPLKNELMMFVGDVEQLAIKGKYEDTGNEISFFVLDTDCETNYSCLRSQNIHLTLFKTFLLNATVSLDVEVFNETTAWIHSMQRMATLISVSGEKIRTAFFDTQRNIINSL